jgi:adenylylsulfate kinase
MRNNKNAKNETRSGDIVWHPHKVTKAEREALKKQRACVLWFTGLSGSGKSTIANEVEKQLYDKGYHTYLLDGDNIRHGLNGDLGFSEEDRKENIRRIGEVAKLFVDSGLIVLTAFISPFRDDRARARDIVGEDFIEVFIDTPLEVCVQRDPKGLYAKAYAGEIKDFTGIDSPYEAPLSPQLHIRTEEADVHTCARQVVEYLQRHGYIEK